MSGYQSLHFWGMQFIAKETKIPQLCFVSGHQPAAQMEQLKGDKRQPLVGQMVLRGGLGDGLGTESRTQAWIHSTKAIYSWARQLGRLKSYHHQGF